MMFRKANQPGNFEGDSAMPCWMMNGASSCISASDQWLAKSRSPVLCIFASSLAIARGLFQIFSFVQFEHHKGKPFK